MSTRSFKDTYPEFSAIEAHIRRARIERAVVVSQLIAKGAEAAIRWVAKIGKQLLTISGSMDAELDRRAVALQRSVPRY